MYFKEVDVFYEQRDHLILVLDAVEWRNPQKLIKFLFWSRQPDFQLFH